LSCCVEGWSRRFGSAGRLQPDFHGSIAPNPTNLQTTIEFDIADPVRAEVAVYDISGRLIDIIYSATGTTGAQRAVWNGFDRHGSPVSSGVYYIRLKVGNATDVPKVVLLKWTGSFVGLLRAAKPV